MTPRLTVVLAVQEGAHRLDAVVGALAAGLPSGVEVIVLWPEDDGEARHAVGALPPAPWLVTMPGPARALVPELWALGVQGSRAPRVALTVVHCVPSPGWIDGLLEADLERFAAVGGPIDQRPGSDALGWAVYLQRYAPFASSEGPHQTAAVDEIAGDNALYARSALDAVSGSWSDGFWEPTVHAALLDEGLQLGMDPGLGVLHDNGYSARGFLVQRLRHGYRFGRDRARALEGPVAAAYAAATPAVPLLFGRKVLQRSLRLREARVHLPGALPWLAVYVGAWSLGEILGAHAGVWARGAEPR